MKSLKKILSFVLCAIMVLSIVPIVDIEAEAASPTVTVDTGSEHYSIGETNAVLCGKVSNPNEAKVSKVGIKLYDASEKKLKEHSETVSFTDTTVTMWFNVNTEIGYTLNKGTTYKYQVYAVVAGTQYTSGMASFTTADADSAQAAVMPLKKIDVTQKAGGSVSHAGTKNVDFGKSQNLYAPFDCKVVYKDTSYAGGNSIVIESTSKVRFADGTYDYMCVLTAHDDDISDLSKGKTIKKGTVYYHTGTYGNVTGEHVHMCVAKGRYAGQYQNSDGNWELKNSILPSNAFFIDASTTISDAGGYTWKSLPVLSVYYNANGGSISSDTYYLSSGDVYKSSDKSKLCHKWTYNEPQKYGLYDYTTFGLSRNGYEFLGWSTTPSGEFWFDQNDTGLLPTHLNPDIKNGNCSVTLYAVWKKVSSAYTLTYNANGGSGAPSSQSGAESYVISSTQPTKSGYTFLGWSTSSSATSASYSAGDTITISSNTTLYAVWEEIPVYNTYELVYDANGGTGAPESLIFSENETIYISEEIPTRFGYVFEGWVSQDGFWYYPGQETMFFEATVLYASWGNHKLSADESTVLEITDECQEVFVEFSPEESGIYTFKSFDTQDNLDTIGILYDVNGTELISDDDSGDGNNFMFYYTMYEGETYYIKVSSFNSAEGTFGFEIVPAYYVTYNANGGQLILGDSVLEEVSDMSTTVPYIEAVRDGYTFVGWSENRTAQYATYTEGDELYLDGNTTLYAVWYKNDLPANPEPDDDLDLSGFLTIRTPSVTQVNYGDSIVLHADLGSTALTGLKITWEASNDNFEIVSVSEDGSECVITPKKSGDTTFTATVEIGTVAYSTDTQVMTSNAGFFQKIIAFFKNLFGLTKTIPEAFKYIY